METAALRYDAAMRVLLRPVLVLPCLLWLPMTAAIPSETTAVVEAGRAYVGLLGERQRSEGVLAFDDANRFAWTFFPGRRRGITLREMNEAQREAALALVRTGLSDVGWQRVQGIFRAERILHQSLPASQRRRNPSWRDPLGYTVTVFGRPGMDTTWGWRIGGHHLSLHVTVKGGTMIAGTPFFLGANPAKVARGANAGFEPLRAQQAAGFALLRALAPEQLQVARTSMRVPGNFRMRPERGPDEIRAAGITAAKLDAAQRGRFDEIVETFAATLAPALRDDVLGRARKARPEQLSFLWQGTTDTSRDHYFRIVGPSFVIEHWNAGNHIHSVWRDRQHEWGRGRL